MTTESRSLTATATELPVAATRPGSIGWGRFEVILPESSASHRKPCKCRQEHVVSHLFLGPPTFELALFSWEYICCRRAPDCGCDRARLRCIVPCCSLCILAASTPCQIDCLGIPLHFIGCTHTSLTTIWIFVLSFKNTEPYNIAHEVPARSESVSLN